MKAIFYDKYGSPDVMEFREVAEPVLAARDVLVRVHAASVGAGDWHMLTCTWFAVRLFQGLFSPKRRVLGFDLAGRVEKVGAKVTRFQPGDEVFGESHRMGTFAELARVREDGLVHKPAGVSYEEAAAVPVSGLTALQGLRDKGRIQPGHRVLVNGASGGVGTFAVQLAKHFGAEVTGVCRQSKMDLVRSIGADYVIDYGAQDFTRMSGRYDIVLDNAGNRPLSACRRTLRPGGTYVAVSGHPYRSAWVGMAGGKQMVTFVAQPNPEDLGLLASLLESGELKPVIDRRFPLQEVPDALRYFGSGEVRGKIVITVRGDG